MVISVDNSMPRHHPGKAFQHLQAAASYFSSDISERAYVVMAEEAVVAVPEEGAGALLEKASSAAAGASVQPSYLQFLSRHRWLHHTLLRQPRQATSPHPRALRKPKPQPECSSPAHVG